MFNSQGKFHLYISLHISSCFSILHVHTGTANSRKARKYKNIYTIETTSLRYDVQLSRVVPFTYISSNFIMFFYLTCSYRHSKLKKGMEVQEHIKKQLKLYKNTFCQLFHCKIQTFHCPNFKPLFPGILKIDFFFKMS